MTKQILGFCGFIGSGKDTAADYFVNNHWFRRDSFAASLKDAVSSIFGWDRTMLEGLTKEAREQREQIDPWWAARLNMPSLTPRWVLQYWGTEVCRHGFHDDIWIAGLEARLSKTTDNIVISDCRFPNEIQAIKDAGGTVYWVQRGELPNWYKTALDANGGHQAAKLELRRLGIHASETAWVGTEFDGIIDNNSTLDALYAQLSTVVR